MSFSIRRDLYSRDVLMKTCYKYTDDYYIHLDADENDYIVFIKPKKELQNEHNIENEFKNALIEQANMELVFLQTKNIREILFARAMASSVIYQESIGNDGFDVSIDDKSSMKDWFENE